MFEQLYKFYDYYQIGQSDAMEINYNRMKQVDFGTIQTYVLTRIQSYHIK